MEKTDSKLEALGVEGLQEVNKMKEALTRDMDLLLALIRFIRETPTVMTNLAEEAVKIRQNVENALNNKPNE